jgi:hypothetical protein
MAKESPDESPEESSDELPEDVDPEELEDLELLGDVPAVDDDDDDDADDDDDDADDDDADAKPEPLDELEAEELEMLTEDESDETIVVDEAAEMRAIRRAEISLEGEVADAASSDEFVCSNCFLVKRKSQLANKRKKLCRDCAG